MRLLNESLENPYIAESPYYEAFERILKKYQEQPNSVLEKQYQKLKAVFNDEESDGLTQYEAEEKAYAITMIFAERDPALKKTLLEKDVDPIELTPDIDAVNPNIKGTSSYRNFERKVSDLCLNTVEELKQDLLVVSNAFFDSDNDVSLKEQIAQIKCAINQVG